MSSTPQPAATALRKCRYPALIIAAVFCIAALQSPARASTAPAWAPVASEKLMKLPGDYLKRAVDNDFARSGLAAAMADSDDRVTLKRDTLADLRSAIERSDGELRLDLEQQFLEEKRDFIKLLGEQQELRRKRAETKIRLYEKLLGRLSSKRQAQSPAHAALLAKQTAARARLEATLSQVDLDLVRSPAANDSKYAQEYAHNISAIEKLVLAVNAHPMNQAPSIDGQPMSQSDYLRQLIASNQAELALADQEGAILGYMAKLVSLDALALSEGLDVDPETVEAADTPSTITSAVEFFITQ